MHEEKREIITKEMILEKFKKNNTPVYVICGVILLVCTGLFLAGMKTLLASVSEQMGDQGSVAKTVLWALMVLAVVGVAFVCGREILHTAKGLKDIREGDVIITHTRFLRHVEFECPRTPNYDGYDTVYFQDGKTYRIYRNHDRSLACSSRLSTALQLSENGDPYIVVTLASDPDTVVDLYCEKFYAYKD